MNTARNIEYAKLTEPVIPSVIRAKYILSSKEFLTGFLNLIIERAPTIPNDKAIFPLITFVTTNVIAGKSM